jgi:hypothetical protein
MAMLTAYDPFAATNAAFRALDQLTGRGGGLTARPLSGMPMTTSSPTSTCPAWTPARSTCRSRAPR